MRLTPFGKEFATYVKRGLREIDKGVELAQEFNGKLGGHGQRRRGAHRARRLSSAFVPRLL